MIPLSVLDLATVANGSSPAQALKDTTRLAVEAERLGYKRLWVAKQDAITAVASSARAVHIEHLAAATSAMRTGSGGVMLPIHPPLVIAERIAALEALHPGRIDLGLGRATGTDHVTARALRRSADLGADHSPDDVVELIRYLLPTDKPTHPAPVPGQGYLPKSGYSAHPPPARICPEFWTSHSPSRITSRQQFWIRPSRLHGRTSKPRRFWPNPTSWWRHL